MANAMNGQRRKGNGKHPNSLANLRKWKPGQSGNPKGMEPGVGHVRELARQHTEESIEKLVEIMRDENAPPSAQGAAANSLLDRGWGRPDQSVTVDNGESLLSILDEIERRADLKEIEGEAIDAHPQPNGERGEKNGHTILIKHDEDAG
ncbi:MAG: hypothetical protein O7A62_06435 [Alphaproteobacteria bacterium]|nr:hypothetical protein [Alphaproteobacteria bacterium]